MRLWTIQPLEVLQDLEQNKLLAADPDRGSGRDFAAAYAWMRGQMAKRVPGYGGGSLWWAYHYKPDLRCERHQMLPQEYVRLELDVPEEEILLSDHDTWHCVLGNCYLPLNEEDDIQFETRLEAFTGGRSALNPPELQQEIERSWERIFTPEILRENAGDPPIYLQATFEWLRMENVRAVKHFFGAYKPKFYGPNAIGPDDLPPVEGYGDTIRVRDRFQIQYINNATGNTYDEGVNILCGYERRNGSYTVYVLNEDGSASSFLLGGKKYRFTRRCTLMAAG